MNHLSCFPREREAEAMLWTEANAMLAFLQVVIAGLVTGSLYGLLALGIVLIYRTTGVLNFAYGAMGALCACFLYILITRSEEHTSELQSHLNLVCRLLLEKKK